MPLVVKDRVLQTTSTVGIGPVTLIGTVSGFQSFSVIGDGNTTYYTITGSNQWEVGIGTYTAAGSILSRDTVLESSSGGGLVNFNSGVKNVFVTYPAEKSVYVDGTSIVSESGATLSVANGGTGATSASGARTNLGLGTAAVLNAGVADGVATLDSSGKVPTSQIPDNINIAGYPVVVSSIQQKDVLMFGVNQWNNVPQTEITDGGNY
jgi:hypothetical protein